LYVPQIAKHRVKKLSRLWKGPYKIVAVKSELNVKLKIRGRIVTVHVNRIKPYIERKVNTVCSTSEASDTNYVTDEEYVCVGAQVLWQGDVTNH
jgi:hypothetical protein